MNIWKIGGSLFSRITRLHMCCTAIALSGVFGEGFHTEALPQIAASDRIPRPHGHRKIECRDDSDDAERMPLLIHPVLRALRMHGEAVEHARLADGEVGDVDHLLHFAEPFGQDLAVLERNERAEILPCACAAPRRAGARTSPRFGAGTLRHSAAAATRRTS